MIEPIFKAVLSAAEKQRGAVHCDELRDVLNAIAELPHDHALALRLKIADSMSEIESPAGAGLLGIWLGASVENGMDPEPTIQPLLQTMLRWTRSMVTLDDDEKEDPDPDEEVVTGTELLGQSLVAHISRAPSARNQLRDEPNLVAELQRVEHLTAGAAWLSELLRKCSGELIVLHAQEPRGVRVEYKNISNCFHLFTLLQGALTDFPGALKSTKQVLAAAKGESFDDVSDNAWWHFGQGNVPEADIGGSVFGEASPDSISRDDDQQVMLLWPPILQGRSWNSGFFAPVLSSALPSVKKLNDLTSDEIAQWREKLQLPS